MIPRIVPKSSGYALADELPFILKMTAMRPSAILAAAGMTIALALAQTSPYPYPGADEQGPQYGQPQYGQGTPAPGTPGARIRLKAGLGVRCRLIFPSTPSRALAHEQNVSVRPGGFGRDWWPRL